MKNNYLDDKANMELAHCDKNIINLCDLDNVDNENSSDKDSFDDYDPSEKTSSRRHLSITNKVNAEVVKTMSKGDVLKSRDIEFRSLTIKRTVTSSNAGLLKHDTMNLDK